MRPLHTSLGSTRLSSALICGGGPGYGPHGTRHAQARRALGRSATDGGVFGAAAAAEAAVHVWRARGWRGPATVRCTHIHHRRTCTHTILNTHTHTHTASHPPQQHWATTTAVSLRRNPDRNARLRGPGPPTSALLGGAPRSSQRSMTISARSRLRLRSCTALSSLQMHTRSPASGWRTVDQRLAGGWRVVGGWLHTRRRAAGRASPEQRDGDSQAAWRGTHAHEHIPICIRHPLS